MSQVYVAQPSDSAAAINAKLAAGLHVVLTPAIYDLEAPLQLTHDNQVITSYSMCVCVRACVCVCVCVRVCVCA